MLSLLCLSSPKDFITNCSTLSASIKEVLRRDELVKKSLQIQFTDYQYFQRPSLRERILRYPFPQPRLTAVKPQTFASTGEKLISQISPEVHRTIDGIDYNGLESFGKLLAQLDHGKTFAEVNIDSREETSGSACVGMCHSLLKNLKKNCGVEGALAAQRKGGDGPFIHAVVIVECLDGFVLIDPRPDPSIRIFFTPFNSSICHKNFSLTAANKGSDIPLTVLYDKAERFEYCTHIANADDLIMKHYVMDCTLSFTAMASYQANGSASKALLVFLNQSKLEMLNFYPQKTKRVISLKALHKKKILAELAVFAAPAAPLKRSFRMSVEEIGTQIVRLASPQVLMQIQALANQKIPSDANFDAGDS